METTIAKCTLDGSTNGYIVKKEKRASFFNNTDENVNTSRAYDIKLINNYHIHSSNYNI